MDHQFIEEQNIPEMYLMGKLSGELREQFEEHYFECDACLEQLRVAAEFRRSLQHVAAEDAAQASASVQSGLLGRLARLTSTWQIIFVGVLLLLVALPIAYLALKAGRTQHQLDEAQLASSRWQQQYEAERQTVEQWQRERQPIEPSLTGQPSAQETGPAAPAPVTGDLSHLRQPVPDTRIVDLAAQQRNEADPAANKITLSSPTEWIVLTMGLAWRQAYESYRATLLTVGGERRWQHVGLQPDEHDDLVINCPPGALPAGQYRLVLEGQNSDGRFMVVTSYALDVVQEP